MLTEDVDLSYRAQLAGWHFVYLGLPQWAELPANIRSFRVQQYRWMKGVAQNTRRFLPLVMRDLREKRAPSLGRVVHEVAHLLEPAGRYGHIRAIDFDAGAGLWPTPFPEAELAICQQSFVNALCGIGDYLLPTPKAPGPREDERRPIPGDLARLFSGDHRIVSP